MIDPIKDRWVYGVHQQKEHSHFPLTDIDPFTDAVLFFVDNPSFTRSNGTLIAKLYERLTKRSRRRQNEGLASLYDQGYRQGLYDAYKALQDELS